MNSVGSADPMAIDEIPIAEPGRLFLCSLAAIARDPQGAVERHRATSVLCLVEETELADHAPGYRAWLETTPAAWKVPIPDFGIPTDDVARRTATRLADDLRDGATVIVHCFGGRGRTSTMAAIALGRLGHATDDALMMIDRHRPGAQPETEPQRRLIERLAGC